jgi:signal transduction histidine kinase
MSKLTDQELIEELSLRFQQNQQNLKELQDVNRKLLTVNKKLEDSEAMKSHFISNITNEIVNPFSSIMGIAEHLNKMGEKDDWQKVQSLVRMIYDEAFELDFQLKNIFTAAKLEAGELTPMYSNVKIIDLINDLIDTYKVKYQKSHVDISFEYEIEGRNNSQDSFKTDPYKLQLIMSNLINNSIRFSLESKKTKIKLTFTNENLIISVRDYGIGINKEHSDKVFDRFYRVNNNINSENKGLGLGLSVTKGILEVMEGSIELKSHDNGSEFIVTVPEDRSTELIKDFSTNGNEFFFEGENEIF